MGFVQLVEEPWAGRDEGKVVEGGVGGVVVGLDVLHVDGEGDPWHLEELPRVVEEVGVVRQHLLAVALEMGVVDLRIYGKKVGGGGGGGGGGRALEERRGGKMINPSTHLFPYLVEPHECLEEADVGLCQSVPQEVPLPAQQGLGVIHGTEQRVQCFLVRGLGGRQATPWVVWWVGGWVGEMRY